MTGVPLEFYAPNQTMIAALDTLRTRDLSRDEILAVVEQHVGVAYLPR